jgi:hypothetical protein
LRAPTEVEFKEWLQHPVTIALMKCLDANRDQLRRQWEAGSFSDYAKDGTILTNVANMGTCKGYAFVMELEYSQLEIEDGE